MKMDPKLEKRIRALGMDFDFEHLTENDWFMIEEILGESLPVRGEEEAPEEDFFGWDGGGMFF